MDPSPISFFSYVAHCGTLNVKLLMLMPLVKLRVAVHQTSFLFPVVHSRVIYWAQESQISCHPGINRTLFIVQQQFWWQAMEKEVAEYVVACTISAHSKTSHQPASGYPPPTTCSTQVDRFPKIVPFIPMPKLPLGQEMAGVMLHHVFHLHGFPRDDASDWGPQFVAQFWQAFCSLLGASISFSSVSTG